MFGHIEKLPDFGPDLLQLGLQPDLLQLGHLLLLGHLLQLGLLLGHLLLPLGHLLQLGLLPGLLPHLLQAELQAGFLDLAGMLAGILVGVGDQEKVVVGHILEKYILNINTDIIYYRIIKKLIDQSMIFSIVKFQEKFMKNRNSFSVKICGEWLIIIYFF